jgi:hypothetical protein
VPQKDNVHDAVKVAMVKDGWSIVTDPYTITYRRSQLYADLCAERADSPARETALDGGGCEKARGSRMDRVKEYREIVKRLLLRRETIARPSLPDGIEVTCLFDDKTGQYALLSIGWMQGERIGGNILLIRIKGGTIWVEEDGTDSPFADELVAAGVPHTNIVLGFQPPEARRYTEFAAA